MLKTRRQSHNAEVIGWGKCLPPARLTNSDLASILATTEEWISSRTGIAERRISHTSVADLASVAVKRALACAGVDANDVDLLILGSCTGDEQVPNTASEIARQVGATKAGVMDVNTACTSAMYALSAATAMIETGGINVAVVIGADALSPYMDWSDRGPAVLFGDGAAALVLRGTDEDAGVVYSKLGATTEGRDCIRIGGIGAKYANSGVPVGTTTWNFEGQEIFRQAVQTMSRVTEDVLAASHLQLCDVDLLIPHQANLRITEAVARRLNLSTTRVYSNVHRYGNTSSAAIPIALAEAMEDGRIQPGAHVVLSSFGSGFTWTGHLIRWGQRVTPIAKSDAELPPCHSTALDMVKRYQLAKHSETPWNRGGMSAVLRPTYPEVAVPQSMSPSQAPLFQR